MTSDDRVRVDVLGPIRVTNGAGHDLTPSGSLQRRLLALLVLGRGRVVSSDAAIDALWPAELPSDPGGALQNHVSRLRRSLPDGVVESVGGGYRLDPSRIELDAERVNALAAGDARGLGVLAEIDAVLDRWQGDAYPDLDDLDEARSEAARLAELRVRLREAAARHRLARGADAELVAELSAMVRAEPLREEPRALLMTALAAVGRRVDALRAYDDFRRLLGDELGIEPSPALAAQHATLLGGAPSDPLAWSPTSRLPVPTTSLVGRDVLVDDVATLVRAHRLVSLVGPGGVGKTRLLVEVGHQLRGERPDRAVVLCELATADTDTVANVVAASLGIDVRLAVPLVDQLATALGDDELVLLVDNCEHVLEPVADLVHHLLARCAGVSVIATTRERLRIAGECVHAVPTLPTGHDSPAVRLFVERASASVTGFEPDGDELVAIAEIVRRLDGLPLAIELAAARLHTHDVAEVAAGLDRRFAMLSAGYRTSTRHASLGAAVSWSFALLDDSLQEVFTSISVFVGPFGVTDAAAVCDAEEHDVAAALAQLTERSLVTRTADRRYVLLETLRAFGAEQLDAAGRLEVVGERHARHMVEWVERADRRLGEPGHAGIDAIDAAIPELHGALGWLIDHGDAELAGRLTVALLDYGFMRLRPDVLAWAERVTAIDPDDQSPVASIVWVLAAYAAWMAGDLAETGVRGARALAVAEAARAAGASGGLIPAEVAATCGNFEMFQGRLDTAAQWYRLAVESATALGDPAQRVFIAATEVLALGYAGDALAFERVDALLEELGDAETVYAAYLWYCAGEADLQGDVDRARSRYERSLEIAERTHASFVTGLAGASKASIDARTGDPDLVAHDYRRLIAHWRRAGMWSTQWTMLRSIAVLLERRGQHREAAVLVGAVHAPGAGHRIFGADEVALRELEARLRGVLGDLAYETAVAEGSVLDGDAAVEHALHSL